MKEKELSKEMLQSILARLLQRHQEVKEEQDGSLYNDAIELGVYQCIGIIENELQIRGFSLEEFLKQD